MSPSICVGPGDHTAGGGHEANAWQIGYGTGDGDITVPTSPHLIVADMETAPLSDVHAFATYMSQLYSYKLHPNSLKAVMPNPPEPNLTWNVQLVRDAHKAVQVLVEAHNTPGKLQGEATRRILTYAPGGKWHSRSTWMWLYLGNHFNLTRYCLGIVQLRQIQVESSRVHCMIARAGSYYGIFLISL